MRPLINLPWEPAQENAEGAIAEEGSSQDPLYIPSSGRTDPQYSDPIITTEMDPVENRPYFNDAKPSVGYPQGSQYGSRYLQPGDELYEAQKAIDFE